MAFTPTHVSKRHDGWTGDRQIRFIKALAESACVEEACRNVGMSDSAAYRLRRSSRGSAFRKAWDAALDYAMHRLEQAALRRALHGVARPIFFRGEQVGEWRYYDERLTTYLLATRRPPPLPVGAQLPGFDPGFPVNPRAEASDRLVTALESIEEACFDEDNEEALPGANESPRAHEK